MKHCPRAVSIARPSTLQLTMLPSELAAAPKGWMNTGGHYDVEMKGWMQKDGIIRCKLKGWMDKGHYDVQIKRCMKKVAL